MHDIMGQLASNVVQFIEQAPCVDTVLLRQMVIGSIEISDQFQFGATEETREDFDRKKRMNSPIPVFIESDNWKVIINIVF